MLLLLFLSENRLSYGMSRNWLEWSASSHHASLRSMSAWGVFSFKRRDPIPLHLIFLECSRKLARCLTQDSEFRKLGVPSMLLYIWQVWIDRKKSTVFPNVTWMLSLNRKKSADFQMFPGCWVWINRKILQISPMFPGCWVWINRKILQIYPMLPGCSVDEAGP